MVFDLRYSKLNCMKSVSMAIIKIVSLTISTATLPLRIENMQIPLKETDKVCVMNVCH